jgi:hypothetical protein
MYGECEASGTAGTPEAGLGISSLLLCSNQLRLPAHWPRSVLALNGVATRDKISIDQIVEILENGLQTCLTWIMTEKQLYEQKTSQEVKELTDKSVEELDENLRK